MKMKRMKTELPRKHLVIMMLFIITAPLAFAKTQPNVIFIMADDLGYGDLGCYGANHFETPACDRLAREGMRFTDAHSPSSVCTPTRYSVLTGRYAWLAGSRTGSFSQTIPC
jgi:arylsulfatase A